MNTDPRRRTDPLADRTITRIFGQPAELPALWATVGLVNRQFAQWQTNGMLATWRAGAEVPPHIADALHDYLREGSQLPAWHDKQQIAVAEKEFFDMSMLSCTLLFCASLPECYLVPDLSAVLHAAGQLEDHTDYRVRSTAAMIFPVMMEGGLCSADGSGVAQALKVRLIHAMIRHLILRGDPEAAQGVIAALPPSAARSMHQAFYENGWNVERDGLPINQEEMAYTLLTFHYIFLRGLRTLHLGLLPEHETAYLHCWNVLGHIIGIERELMASTMIEAETLFKRLQDSGLAHPYAPDPRPGLGQALMAAMANVIPLRVLKPLPVLLTRTLCGSQATTLLGLDQQVNWLTRILYMLGMGLCGTIDAIGRLFLPEFSLVRMFTRVAGYHLTSKLLMDETRPLNLPAQLLNPVQDTLRGWSHDRKAPGWVNALERRLTGRQLPAAEGKTA